jgi:MFS family permease
VDSPLAAQPRTAPPSGTGSAAVHAAKAGHLLASVFLLLLAINVAIGIYFGAVQVAVTAFAHEQSSTGSAAALYAISSTTGVLGSWLFGLRTWRPSTSAQLRIATGALSAAALLATAADSFVGVAVALGLAGFAVPPILVLASVLTQRQVDQTVLTQAFTWLNSASAAGSAAAAAIAGLVIDTFQARGGFALAAAAALTMTLLAARTPTNTPR